MSTTFKGKERRGTLRFEYKRPLKYSIVDTGNKKDKFSAFVTGISKNLSVSGILFLTSAKKIPKLFSLLAFELDYRTIHICQDIENRALIINDKLLGRVMRVEEHGDGTCGIGVAFVTKPDNGSGYPKVLSRD